MKVRKKAKIRNRYNQAPHLTHGTTWESNKYTIKNHKQESREVSQFPASDHKATMNRRKKHYIHETQITKMIHKRSTA